MESKNRKTRNLLVYGLGLTLLFPTLLQADSVPTAGSIPKEALSIKTVQLDVPYVKQEAPKDCGLAVLKMLFEYYGQKMSRSQIDWVKKQSRTGQGASAADLAKVLKESGFETALYDGTLNDETNGLVRQLEKQRPLIVMITSKDGKDSHYDLITGYDLIRYYVILMDPALGRVIVHRQDFDAAWKRANNLTLMAVPKKLLPPTTTPKAGKKGQ